MKTVLVLLGILQLIVVAAIPLLGTYLTHFGPSWIHEVVSWEMKNGDIGHSTSLSIGVVVSMIASAVLLIASSATCFTIAFDDTK